MNAMMSCSSSLLRLTQGNHFQAKWVGAMARRFSSESADKSIAFVALGNMGLPMAVNLGKNAKDTSVLAFDLNEDAMKVAVDAGLQEAKSLEEISSQCSVIFTMLPGCDAVNKVMPTLLESAPQNSNIVFVDCSTVSV